MKATSGVLVQVQRQMTFLGLPPRLLMLSVMAGTAGLIAGVALGSPAILLIGFVGGFAVAWIHLFRRAREDLHYDRRILSAPRFWIGHGQHRALVAGGGCR
ncbi:MAG: hypothetical protein RIC16_03835 [Rhodospirillales bacterium]